MLFYSVFIQNIGIEEPADWEKRFDMSNADSRRVGSSMPIFLFFDVVEKVFSYIFGKVTWKCGLGVCCSKAIFIIFFTIFGYRAATSESSWMSVAKL